ncbi:hypothetical protein Srufu_044450 [Streptomyces libani subsp. rufus]|nr:hypothetical protein Srufu_044450 [Streptomyces libani subsp. rufus]
MPHGGPLEIGDLVAGDREDKGLEGLAGVAVARQRTEHRDTHFLRQILDEVPGITRQPRQPGTAVAQGEGVHMGQKVMGGPLVTLHGACDEIADFLLPVITHRTMVPWRRAIRGIRSALVH